MKSLKNHTKYFIRNPKDRITIAIVIALVVLWLVVWLSAPDHLFYLGPFLFIMPLALHTIRHNHLHHPIFVHKGLNFFLENVLNVCTGTTFSGLKIIHLINHHQAGNSNEDWGYTKPFERQSGIKALMSYIVSTIINFIYGRRAWLSQKGSKAMKKKAFIEQFILFTALFVFIVLDVWQTIWFIFVPGFIAQLVLILLNFLQHNACDQASEYMHSRDFTRKALNTLLFNAGYHTVHHLWPKMHWSEYPAKHQSIAHLIHPEFNQESLIAYLFDFLISTVDQQDTFPDTVNEEPYDV